VGVLWVAPFLVAAFAWRKRGGKDARETRLIAVTAAAAGTAILVFLVSTHLATQRYEADFLPLLVLAAAIRLALTRRRLAAAAACAAIAYSATVNLALGIAGPYDEHFANRPASYLKLDRRFALAPEHRRLVSPPIDIRLEAQFAAEEYREPIVTVGQSHYCYFLYVEWRSGGLRIVSRTNVSERSFDLPHPGPAVTTIRFRYVPEYGDAIVEVNGRQAIAHSVGMLIAAPSQVAIGRNDADVGLTAPRFTASLRTIERRIGR
jgi:hypothetical protein